MNETEKVKESFKVYLLLFKQKITTTYGGYTYSDHHHINHCHIHRGEKKVFIQEVMQYSMISFHSLVNHPHKRSVNN